MIHAYAVVDGATVDAAVEGIDRSPVEIVAVGDLGVAVTRHASSSVPASTDAILAHARVCDVLLQCGCTVLPVRFGARYADDVSLRETVNDRAGAFHEALQHVRGRVEIGVRVADAHADAAASEPPAAAPPATGAAYLQRRNAEEQQRLAAKAAAQVVADEIHDLLQDCAVDAAMKVQATPGLVLSAAYLVPADAVDSFTDAVAEVSSRRSDLQLLCTGPWPPYHFAGEGALT